MKQYLIILFFALLMTPVTLGQENITPAEALADGDFFYYAEDYTEALYNFLKLVDTDLMNANISFKIGMCYLNIQGDEPKGISFFEEALKNISPKYRKRSPKETLSPEYAYFYLGQAYRIKNQLDKALDAFNHFLNLPDFDKKYNRNQVMNEVKACEKGKIIQDIPVNVQMINIGPPINSAVSNYSPVISSDESVMVFMSELKFYNGIFVSRKNAGKWTDPENITPQIGSDGDVIPTSISIDKQTIYLVKGEGDKRDICVTHFDGTFWTKLKPLNENINTVKEETHACISSDGKTLIFTSARRGGFGGLDIYSSKRIENGDWGPAQNLGDVINTSFNEETPYLSTDNSILYFSSQSHYNMGGYDIFYSKRNKNGKWGDPVNIGYPINTTGDDLGYVPIGNGSVGYMSRIMDDGYGKKDIYQLTIFPGKEYNITAEQGILDMKGLKLSFDQDFDIDIFDKATKQVIGMIHYHKASGKFSYTSKTGNLGFTFEEKKR